MSEAMDATRPKVATPPAQYDVVGDGGDLYALHSLRGMGLRVRAFEAGSGVGGT